MADAKLALEVGTEVAKMLHASLDEISAAVDRSDGQVSFSVTCAFLRGPDNDLKVKLTPRKRIPLPAVEIKIAVINRQLTLFESPPVDERGEPEEGGDPSGGDQFGDGQNV